jgi:hypothetical protein
MFPGSQESALILPEGSVVSSMLRKFMSYIVLCLHFLLLPQCTQSGGEDLSLDCPTALYWHTHCQYPLEYYLGNGKNLLFAIPGG